MTDDLCFARDDLATACRAVAVALVIDVAPSTDFEHDPSGVPVRAIGTLEDITAHSMVTGQSVILDTLLGTSPWSSVADGTHTSPSSEDGPALGQGAIGTSCRPGG